MVKQGRNCFSGRQCLLLLKVCGPSDPQMDFGGSSNRPRKSFLLSLYLPKKTIWLWVSGNSTPWDKKKSCFEHVESAIYQPTRFCIASPWPPQSRAERGRSQQEWGREQACQNCNERVATGWGLRGKWPVWYGTAKRQGNCLHGLGTDALERCKLSSLLAYAVYHAVLILPLHMQFQMGNLKIEITLTTNHEAVQWSPNTWMKNKILENHSLPSLHIEGPRTEKNQSIWKIQEIQNA